jgi:hypothetical protein
MATSEPIILELSLVQSAGPWFKPGMPILYCWFHAVHVQDAPDDSGRVLVVGRDQATGTWREFTLMPEAGAWP